MFEYIIVAALAILVVLVIIWFGVRRPKVTFQSSTPPNVYDRSYFPGMPGSTAEPLPLWGRTERKRTETFRQHSDN